MNFLYFASKNPFRNKLRTFFVIILLTLGILAVIGSVTFSEITTNAIEQSLDKGGSDITLGKDNITTTDLNNIKGLDGIQNAVGVKEYEIKLNNNISYMSASFTGKDLKNNANIEGIGMIKLISGNLFGSDANEIILTKEAANDSGKNVGDVITVTGISDENGNIGFLTHSNTTSSTGGIQTSTIETSNANDPQDTTKTINKQFKIVGIIDNIPQISALIPIQTLNNILYNTSESNFSYIALKANDGQLKKVETTLNNSYPEFNVVSGDTMANEMKKILVYLTLFFVGIGAIIMVITTLKSVGERTREIGVLKAIGWTNTRVMGLILVEAFIQFLLAWILAIILLVIIFVYITSTVPELGGINYLKDNTMMILSILGFSFAFSILMPLLGCLIPLVRVARLKPTEALKYE